MLTISFLIHLGEIGLLGFVLNLLPGGKSSQEVPKDLGKVGRKLPHQKCSPRGHRPPGTGAPCEVVHLRHFTHHAPGSLTFLIHDVFEE